MQRFHVGASDDRAKAVSRVENLLEQLKPKAVFDALNAGKRQEITRLALVLLLELTLKRMLK